MKYLIIILLFTFVSCAMGQWSPEIRVTYDPALDATPKIAVDSKGNIHVVWWSSRNPFPYDEEIYYTKLDSKGNKLIEDKRITETIGNSTNPVIVIDSRDNVHLVWRDQPEIADYARIYYAKLDNEGNILVPSHQVVDAFGIWFNWLYPGVAMDSRNNLHIVWDEYRYFEGPTGTYTLHYSKLDSMGNVLIQDIRLTPYEERNYSFETCMNNQDQLHVLWSQAYDPLLTDVIMYAKLDSMGCFIIAPKRITPVERKTGFRRVLIDKDNNLHLFMSVYDTMIQTYYTKLDNNGNSLIDEFKIIDQDNSNYFLGAALDEKGQIYILQTDDFNAKIDIYFLVIDILGRILVSRTEIDTYTSFKMAFDVVASKSGQIDVVWQDNRTGIYEDIFFRYYRPKDTAIYSTINDRFPEQSEVFKNYPNPFNACTTIKFHLPQEELYLITLKIFDILGDEIITLLNKVPHASGEYEIIWDGKDKLGKEVSSGIYLNELNIQKLSGSLVFRKANKMILVR